MKFWNRVLSAVGGRRALMALGALYVAFSLGWAYVEVTRGTPGSNVLLISLFIGVPGIILLSGGYWLSRTNINPLYYPTVATWCFVGIATITSVLTLYHFQPAASISNPGRAILIISGFVVVPAFLGGVNDARAKTRAYELERVLDLLHKTEQIADIGGWEIDANTLEVFWTDHIYDLLEVPFDEEPPLDQALDLYDEDDRPLVESAIENSLESGEPFDMEVRMRPASGEERWIRLQGVPNIVNGDVASLRGTAQDVSQQKERERALEDAKLQFEAATEAGAVGTWEWQIPEGEMVVGSSFAQMFGVDPERAREGVAVEEFFDSIHRDDRERVLAAVETAIESCGTFEEESRVWDGDDNLRWVIARGHVECDENGEAIQFPGALTDITDRKHAEAELQQNKEQLETLFEVLPVGVVVAEADGKIIEANNTAHEIWGGNVFDADSVEEYEKYPVFWADSGEQVDGEEMTLARVTSGEEVTEPEVFEIDAIDGESKIVQIEGMPIRNEVGNVIRGVVTMSDITERREYARKLEDSNERLEQFAYAASHDLQEPLRMVSSYLRLVENRYADELDEDGQEFIEFAVDGAERMRAMIDGLLEYSRVETEGKPFEPVDLDEVVEDVRSDLKVRLIESDAEVDVTELPRVEGDADQLRQVFQNLVSNAIEYSGDEPPRVSISAERKGSRWTVSVRDEGIGIPPAEQDRIFDVFSRLQTRENHDGSGIGLALCERIVERHGGDIWVDSEPGEESTFSFTLPSVN